MKRKQALVICLGTILFSPIAVIPGFAAFPGFAVQKAYASSDALTVALSDRHKIPSFAELEQIAGGHDQLIDRLLELRGDQVTPQVGIRSARILLEHFQGEENIAAAFEEDLSRDDRKGIAQVIALNLDRVPSSEARVRLAQGILEKAKSDSNYAVFAKSLIASHDTSVRELAKQSLE